jgi:tetratricopeptide (TPR) repeat protein
MLAALAGGWAPEAVACAVLGQAGGNPFFVEQLYRHLAEGGQGEVPGTVRLVLGHRFARLSDTARRLLDAVAVLGRDADLASAAAVAGLDEEAALEAVEAAEGVDLVQQAADGDVDRIVFRHDLVRHTLLAGLSAGRKRRLHARAAEVLQGSDPAAGAAIAGHLLQAGRLASVERTVAALHRAARDALAAAAFAEAARLLELGLDRARDAATRAPLLADLALAERALGRPDAAIQHWQAALAVFEACGDARRAADVCLEVCRVQENAGQWAEAAATARRGLARLPESDTLRRVNLLAQLVNSTSFAGGFVEAAAALGEAEAIAATGAEPEMRVRVLIARAMHHFTRAAFPNCAAAAAAGLGGAEQTADLYWAAMAGTLVQRSLTAVGRLDDASAFTVRLGEIAGRVGHVMVAHNERNVAVLDLLVTGDLDEFAARTDEDLQRCRSGGLRWLADAEASAGQVAFWRGDPHAALRHLEEAVRLEPPGRRWCG